jgi:hypothetical protein
MRHKTTVDLEFVANKQRINCRIINQARPTDMFALKPVELVRNITTYKDQIKWKSSKVCRLSKVLLL